MKIVQVVPRRESDSKLKALLKNTERHSVARTRRSSG